MDWHLCCIATDFGHQRRHTIAIAIHVCSWFVAVAVGNNSMRYEELRKCGKEREREKQKGSCNRASMQHTLRKIQTPSMCCRCQLGRSTNRPAWLPPGRLLPSNCNCNLSLACLARLSVSVSVYPSLCPAVCPAVCHLFAMGLQLKLEATLVRPVDALSAIACTFWSVSVSHHQQRRFCS